MHVKLEVEPASTLRSNQMEIAHEMLDNSSTNPAASRKNLPKGKYSQLSYQKKDVQRKVREVRLNVINVF